MKGFIRFLLFTFSKKAGSYILILIHLTFVFLYLKFLIDSSPVNVFNFSSLENLSGLINSSVFSFSGIFSILVVIHVFKDLESRNIEILIVSKPITRKKIILSKFLTVFILLFLHQIIIFISYFAFSFYDTQASLLVKFQWSASLFFGGFIVQTIYIFIITLIALIFGKVGIAIMSYLFMSFILVLSYILSSVGKAYVSEDYFMRDDKTYTFKSFQLNSEKINDENKGLSINNIYKYHYKPEEKNKELWRKYHKENSYRHTFPLDFWYQWERFYNIFLSNKALLKSKEELKKWKEVSVSINSDDVFLEIPSSSGVSKKYNLFLSVTSKKTNYIPFLHPLFSKPQENTKNNSSLAELLKMYFRETFGETSDIKSIKDLSEKIKKLFDASDKKLEKSVGIKHFNKQNLNGRLSILNDLVHKLQLERLYWPNDSINYSIQKIITVTIYKILLKELQVESLTINKNVPKGSFTPSNYNLIEIGQGGDSLLLGYSPIAEPYATTEAIILVWILILIILGATSSFIFLQRDFR